MQKLHRYYQQDMEDNMAAYKQSVASEYQARFEKIQQAMQDGGDLKVLSLEDPDTIRKREQELKEATDLVQSLREENGELTAQMAGLKAKLQENQ